MRFSVEGKQGIQEYKNIHAISETTGYYNAMGRLYGGYHELLAFLGEGGGGTADPLAPLPVPPLMYSQFVLVAENTSCLNSAKNIQRNISDH